MNKKNLVIFDFDGTLVDIQSADIYCIFVAIVNLNPTIILKIIFYKFLFVPFNAKINKTFINPRYYILSLLKGINSNKFKFSNKIFVKFLKRKIIKKTFIKFENHISAGDDVVVISAGYAQYINKFFFNFPITLISSRLDFSGGKFVGSLLGKDCQGGQKVIELKNKFNLDLYKNIYCYSDHIVDKPLFDLSNFRFFVKKRNNKNLVKIDNVKIIQY